ncbi:hypothetical protein FPV67DRAFT_592426 [Lyophyllum atratum]|nr:hypothetical protein FPV67DRAFT_592426 [Lyophyllum atratum]
MLAWILLVAAAILAPSCSAKPVVTPTPENFDPKCGEGMQTGFEMDTFQYNVPAEKFFEKMGTYFNSEWYIGPLLESTGEDDTVGATRSGEFNGTYFRERLVDFSKSPDRLMHRFTLDNGPIAFGTVMYASYTEEMVVLSICGGTATFISFNDVYCAEDGPAAYNIYHRARRLLMDKLADDLGALIFSGTCPSGR